MTPWGNPSPELMALLGLILIGALIGLAILLLGRPRRQPQSLTSPSFERSFGLLIEGRWQDSAAVFSVAVKNDPSRTLEYLALGKLFRRQGQPGRAARILEQLKARPDLNACLRLEAHYELALCYRMLGWYDPAVTLLEHVLASGRAPPQARQELRRLHEERGHWEHAAALEMLRLKWGETRDRRTLAALLTQQGKVAWARGRLVQSAAHLRAALALDPDCTEAVLYLGRVLVRQGKLSQAFQLWECLAEARPEWLFLAFRDMQAAFRHRHDEAGWERFLCTFTERHPGDAMGHLALAECYASRGQTQEASHCLCRVVDLDPGCREAHAALLALHRAQGAPADVLDSYERLIQQASGRSDGRFRCHACAHLGHEPFWRCPTCHLWATPERLFPQPSVMPVGVEGNRLRFGEVQVDASPPMVLSHDVPPPSRTER